MKVSSRHLACYRLARAGATQKTCAHCETKAIYARKRKAERVAKKGYLP